jgi:hypothetical protein
MIINSQFFITYYMGKEPLPLKTVPTNLTTAQRADYERFIQNIGAIYGSQTPNGKIPKFWTKLTQITDALGNTKYSYIPHPDSDLEFLSSKSSYYFIVRDESSIPLKIPAIGGSLIGFTDTSMVPIVVSSSIKDVRLTAQSGNTVSITPRIENLQPYETYRYEFKSVDANWPVLVSPQSGVIKPSSASGTINAQVSFCIHSSGCGTHALDYNTDSDFEINNPNHHYSTIALSITPQSYVGQETLSDQFSIYCDDCLPKPSINIVGDTALTSQSFIALTGSVPSGSGSSPSGVTNSVMPKFYKISQPLSPDRVASFDFTLNIDSLLANTEYEYKVESLDAEWPTLFIGQCSGILDIKSQSTKIPPIPSKLVFCHATGVCKPDSPGINPYIVPTFNYPPAWNQPRSYNVLLRASLTPLNRPNDVVYSDPVLLSYEINKAFSPMVNLNIQN